MKELWVKIREALVSALPITLIVYLFSFFPGFSFNQTELISFTIGAILLILGIGLFNLGADIAMTPMGIHVGAGLSRQKAIGLLLAVCFVLGMLITIQLLGFRAIVSNKVKEKRAMKRILQADDEHIINFM